MEASSFTLHWAYRPLISLLLLSFLIFLVPEFAKDESIEGVVFLFNVGILVSALVVMLMSRRTRPKHPLMPFRGIVLLISLISAYSLNRLLPLFSENASWFNVLLLCVSANYLVLPYFQKLPFVVRHVSATLCGVSLIVFLYLSGYLIPGYAFSILALPALGLSAHTFIPLIFVVTTVFLAIALGNIGKQYLKSFFAGSAVVVAIVVGFAIYWNRSTNKLNDLYHTRLTQSDPMLPGWMSTAQEVVPGEFAEKLIKQGIVYTVFDKEHGNIFWNPPIRRSDLVQIHDPLIAFASLFSRPLELNEDERIQVLESVYDARHETAERFWTGMDLQTTRVSTAVKVWPNLRYSYTEKVITVLNTNQSAWSRQEALYTFYLPEGGVITSLSLWIKGVEQKGILTTKEKAETAYNTIVGVESRDPSVVYWMEGNTVLVRVFPVERAQYRVFKLGITAPLREEGEELIYENVYFKGPASNSAEQSINFDFIQQPDSFVMPASFDKRGASYTATGKMNHNWQVRMNAAPVVSGSFFFDGNEYRVLPYDKQYEPFDCRDVYLDINRSWTTDELESIVKLMRDSRLWIYDEDKFQLLEQDDWKEKCNHVLNQQFSLFPFFLVPYPGHSLVISKGTVFSPNLSQLEGSRFSVKLKNWAKDGNRIRVFNLGVGASPFLKSLRELRLVQYDFGDLNVLAGIWKSKRFVLDAEDDNNIVLHEANVRVQRRPGEGISVDPDHNMRLFAYNHLMKNYSTIWSGAGSDTAALVEEATQAYVVSPVSSLVVLETKKDYERFDIKDDANSLKNASLKSKGAVPEPHEWALIIIAAGIAVHLLLKRKSKLSQ
jgi:XrtN system VIT domain protein